MLLKLTMNVLFFFLYKPMNAHILFLSRSIGIFVHSVMPWELCVVDGSVMSVDNVDRPDFLHFFTILATHVVPVNERGHVDIFVPLGSNGTPQQYVCSYARIQTVDNLVLISAIVECLRVMYYGHLRLHV